SLPGPRGRGRPRTRTLNPLILPRSTRGMVIASERGAPSGRRRRGAISAAAMVFYGLVVVVLLYVTPQIAWRRHTRHDLTDADDAAPHAAAPALVTESVSPFPYVSTTPLADVNRDALVGNARAVGEQLAKLNPVGGKPLVLKDNPRNLTGGEIYV